MLDITLLGTAALMPLPDRALSAARLLCRGRSILFDCGEGTQTAARRASVSLMKTDVIALTHYHGDHIFGLPGLLQTMQCMGRTEPLYIVGPEGIEAELAPIRRLAGYLPYEVRLRTLPVGGIALKDWVDGWESGARLTAFPTSHRVPSIGYRFELLRSGKFLPERASALGIPIQLWSVLQRGECVTVGERLIRPEEVLGAPRRGLSFVFSGDTVSCPSLLEGAKDADLLICDATYGEDEQAAVAEAHGHMTFSEAGALARDAGVRRLWLTHYSQMIEDPEEYLPNAQRFFPDAECGADGKHIQLSFED